MLGKPDAFSGALEASLTLCSKANAPAYHCFTSHALTSSGGALSDDKTLAICRDVGRAENRLKRLPQIILRYTSAFVLLWTDAQ